MSTKTFRATLAEAKAEAIAFPRTSSGRRGFVSIDIGDLNQGGQFSVIVGADQAREFAEAAADGEGTECASIKEDADCAEALIARIAKERGKP